MFLVQMLRGSGTLTAVDARKTSTSAVGYDDRKPGWKAGSAT
jgi:hypothetical protein